MSCFDIWYIYIIRGYCGLNLVTSYIIVYPKMIYRLTDSGALGCVQPKSCAAAKSRFPVHFHWGLSTFSVAQTSSTSSSHRNHVLHEQCQLHDQTSHTGPFGWINWDCMSVVSHRRIWTEHSPALLKHFEEILHFVSRLIYELLQITFLTL